MASSVDQESLCWSSATRLASLVQAGEVASVELVKLFASRIDALDVSGGVNAVVVRDFDRALERAALADAAVATGEIWGPLHGVPMTVKENNDVQGLPTTLGRPDRRDQVAAQNSVPVQRLLDAGAIILGKTNCALDLNDVQTYNDLYGCTRNPYDLSVTCGGSSGGSAAALASGFTALEFGGDIGGSIRTPAHCCGVFGHKATFGIIPVGHSDIVVKGPMARTPEDLALALDVVAGPTGPLANGWKLQLPAASKQCLKDFRVAVWGDDATCPVDADVAGAVSRLVSALRQAGAHVDEDARPGFDAAEVFDLYKQLLAAAENTGLSPAAFEEALREAAALDPDDRSELAMQKRWIAQSHHSWHAADVKRQALRGVWDKFFQDFDILVAPACCSDAWPHDFSGTTDQPFWKVGNRIVLGNGLDTPYHRQVFWAGVTNVAFNPSTAFPAGRSAAGLPIGLQAVGAEFADHTTIAFARALAAEAEGFSFIPPSSFEGAGPSQHTKNK